MPEPSKPPKTHIVVCPLCGEVFELSISVAEIPDHTRRDFPSIKCQGSGTQITKVT